MNESERQGPVTRRFADRGRSRVNTLLLPGNDRGQEQPIGIWGIYITFHFRCLSAYLHLLLNLQYPPPKDPPTKESRVSDILYRLATEYTILDQVTGVRTAKTNTKAKNTKPSEIKIVDGRDPVDIALTGFNLRDAQQQASQLSKEFIKGKRKIFDKFAANDALNKNRRNAWLDHTRESSLL